jgi:hypothetical protein
MFKINKAQITTMFVTVAALGRACGSTAAAVRVEGQVQAGGGPLANSSVTLWGASAGLRARHLACGDWPFPKTPK